MARIPLLLFLLLMSFSSTTQAKVVTQVVEYKHGDTVLEGFLAYDDAKSEKRAGVLLIHDWMGVGEQVRDRATALASMGYVAFAADIYGKGIRPQSVADAGAQATRYRSDRNLMRARARAGLDYLASQPNVDPTRLVSMGYCFGGGVSLELARSGAPLVGAVSFHGNLDTPNPGDASQIKAKVLVLHGADDPYVPREQVVAFEQEMRTAKVDWQLTEYGGAVHAFTNPRAGNDPSKGAAYHANADKRSWLAFTSFINETTGR